MDWISFPDDRLKVFGLHWFDEDKPTLQRLPARMKEHVREAVWDMARQPAGGRIRFSTDSEHVSIRAKSPDYAVLNHITRIGQSGFDVYVDNHFMGSTSPDEHCVISVQWRVGGSRKMRNIEISMPLCMSVTIEAVGIEEGASIEDPRPYRLPKPIVYYGYQYHPGRVRVGPRRDL